MHLNGEETLKRYVFIIKIMNLDLAVLVKASTGEGRPLTGSSISVSPGLFQLLLQFLGLLLTGGLEFLEPGP